MNMDEVVKEIVYNVKYTLEDKKWCKQSMEQRIKSVWAILVKKDIRLKAVKEHSNQNRCGCFKFEDKLVYLTINYTSIHDYSFKMKKQVISSHDNGVRIKKASIEDETKVISANMPPRVLRKSNVLRVVITHGSDEQDKVLDFVYDANNINELRHWIDIMNLIIEGHNSKSKETKIRDLFQTKTNTTGYHDSNMCQNCDCETEMTYSDGNITCTECGVMVRSSGVNDDGKDVNPYGESHHSSDSGLISYGMCSTAPDNMFTKEQKAAFRKYEHAHTMETITSTACKTDHKKSAFDSIDHIAYIMALPERVSNHAKKIFSEQRDSQDHLYKKISLICACVARAYVKEYGLPKEGVSKNHSYKCCDGRWFVTRPRTRKIDEVSIATRIKRKRLDETSSVKNKVSLEMLDNHCDNTLRNQKTDTSTSFNYNGARCMARKFRDSLYMIPEKFISFKIRSIRMRTKVNRKIRGTFFIQIIFDNNHIYETPGLFKSCKLHSTKCVINEPILYTNMSKEFEIVVRLQDGSILDRVKFNCSDFDNLLTIVKKSSVLSVKLCKWFPTLHFKQSEHCRRSFDSFEQFKKHASTCYKKITKKRKRSLYDPDDLE